MRITPLDVRKQEFRKVVRGLDADEVYAFLATVADEYEVALSDNKQLRERLLDLEEKVTEYRSMEKTLRDTLLTAERVMGDARQNAQKEADLILRDARVKAEQETSNISARVESLKAQLRELRGHRDSFLARLKGLSEAQIGLVHSYQKEFEREDSAISINPRPMASSAPAPSQPQPASAPTPAPATSPAPARQSAPPQTVVAPEPTPDPVESLSEGPLPTPPLPSDPPDVWRNYIVGAKSHESTDFVADVVKEVERESGSRQALGPVASSAASIEEPSPEAEAVHDEELAGESPSSEILEGAGEPSPATTSPGGWSMKRFTQGLGEV